MPQYKAPIRDISFAYREVINFDNIQQLANYQDVDHELIDTVLNECAKFCENELFPLNQSGDQEGCIFANGEVKTPKGFQEAYKHFVQGGWLGLALDQKYGGQGLPKSLEFMIEEVVCAANISFGLYPGLTKGACKTIMAHGSDALKDKYLLKMIDGTWGGTMNLTEPQSGTDLGLLQTKAVAQKDGSYKITGSKIFISSGEHDLTENIIHLVLARTPDAPKGTKGISMFLVPKYFVDENGSIGKRNNVLCSAIEHKMGIKASSTCVMNYDDATGWLLGDLHNGLDHMFTMMNIERLSVGIQGLGVADIAYQNALSYAKERLQGRALTGAKYPKQVADPLIVHPDIRRMLLTMKAYNEGNRMLTAWVANAIDIAEYSTDEQQKSDADSLINLLTPVVKAFSTDMAFEMSNLALQVFGGYGYITEYGIDQYVRDSRITQIYEGANGIQALDLVGRKLGHNMGAYLRSFFHPVQEFINHYQDDQHMAEFVQPLAKSFSRLQRSCIFVAQKGLANPDEAGAAATDFLSLFGHTALAYLWSKAVVIARKEMSNEPDFYNSKIETARFYISKLLPKTSGLFANIMSGSRSVMSMKDEEFGPFEFTGHKN